MWKINSIGSETSGLAIFSEAYTGQSTLDRKFRDPSRVGDRKPVVDDEQRFNLRSFALKGRLKLLAASHIHGLQANIESLRRSRRGAQDRTKMRPRLLLTMWL